MKIVEAHRAEPVRDEETRLVLRIVHDLPRERDEALYERDARQIAEALYGSLPGATFDRLLAELLRQKASKLVVTYASFEPKEEKKKEVEEARKGKRPKISYAQFRSCIEQVPAPPGTSWCHDPAASSDRIRLFAEPGGEIGHVYPSGDWHVSYPGGGGIGGNSSGLLEGMRIIVRFVWDCDRIKPTGSPDSWHECVDARGGFYPDPRWVVLTWSRNSCRYALATFEPRRHEGGARWRIKQWDNDNLVISTSEWSAPTHWRKLEHPPKL